MDWIKLSDLLPKDKQLITIYDDGLDKELQRIFYLEFWQKNKRVLDCSHFCRKWKPRNN